MNKKTRANNFKANRPEMKKNSIACQSEKKNT